MFAEILKAPDAEVAKSARAAYDRTLIKFHGFVIKNTMKVALKNMIDYVIERDY